MKSLLLAIALLTSNSWSHTVKAEKTFSRGDIPIPAARATWIKLKKAANYHHRGLEDLRLSNNEKAVESFTKAIELNPSAKSYYHRGLAYHYLGKTKKASADYRSAIKREPKFAEAYKRGFIKG